MRQSILLIVVGYFRNHYFLLETKRRVLELISEMPGLEEGKVCDGYTARAVEFTRDLIRVQERIAPGYSELRAYLSNHIAVPLYWLTKVKRFISIIRSFVHCSSSVKIYFWRLDQGRSDRAYEGGGGAPGPGDQHLGPVQDQESRVVRGGEGQEAGCQDRSGPSPPDHDLDCFSKSCLDE